MVPGVPKEWQISRYNLFIDDIIRECVTQNAVLVLAGDLLDSASPLKEELQLFMYFLHELNKASIDTLLVSGNHCSIKRGSSILDYLEVSQFENVYYRKNYHHSNIEFHLCNHDEIHNYTPVITKPRNILISHARCAIPPHITEEIDMEAFTAPYDLCILGDIHMAHSFGNTYYTNNPVNKIFEESVNTGYLVVDIGKDIKVTRVKTEYPALRAVSCTVEELPALRFNKTDFYKVEVTGTPEELRALKEPAPYIKLCKIPLLPDVLPSEELYEEPEVENLADDLVGYMKHLKYTDAQISELLEELEKPLD
jgi:DNA repair exonuclease SbcCD nuclease subunit